MSVKEQAYQEMYKWLDGDQHELEPRVPYDLHPMAVEQWEAGAAEAHLVYNAEEAQWVKIENFMVLAVKLFIVGAIIAAVYWIRHPLVILAGGALTTYLLRRWIK